ncbi:MAG: outer membrane lipid asymmetry maintenance protein MlaD [Methylococcaceae bacterium]|jgi:phospholipid/cholesterol/gamma-HCH transport system substrate-binding protein
MPHNNTQDTLVGLFVAAGIASLFFLALQVSNLSSFTKGNTYEITARFSNSGGLKVKSAVSAAGVKIGSVKSITFDPKTHESVVKMDIDAQYNTLPDDSDASIFTAGLLGEQYISLNTNGGSDEYLKNGSKIEITSGAIILEQALTKFFLNKEDKNDDKKSSSKK